MQRRNAGIDQALPLALADARAAAAGGRLGVCRGGSLAHGCTGPKFIPHNTPLAQAKTRTMKTTGRPGRWLIILPPLLFLLIFFLIPFAFAFKISFAETASRVPPFTDVISFTRDHPLQLTLTLGNYRYLLTDEVYGVAYLYSLRTAFFSTLVCLALGYPMAYAIARSPQSARGCCCS